MKQPIPHTLLSAACVLLLLLNTSSGFQSQDLPSSYVSPATQRLVVENFGPVLPHRVHAVAQRREGAKSIYTFTDPTDVDPETVALEFARSQLDATEFVVSSAYKSEHSGVTHVYLRQVVGGLEVVNGDININVDRDGRVLSFGDSFWKGQRSAAASKMRRPKESCEDCSNSFSNPEQHVLASSHFIPATSALESLLHHLHLPPSPLTVIDTSSYLASGKTTLHLTNVPHALSPIPARLSYLQTSSDALVPVWDLIFELPYNWFHAHVDARSGDVLSLTDWYNDATYTVFPFGYNDPRDGDREVISDPWDPVASPNGWHVVDPEMGVPEITTAGYNVFAQDNSRGNRSADDFRRPVVGKDLAFDFELDLENEPEDYWNASTVNLFYWNNIIHDLYYRYGFTERAGNFQNDNFGRGGTEGDAVLANSQDGSGFNNAMFGTPPDGQNGRMYMFIWTLTEPNRDGDLEAGIMIHEYTHGLSQRLTGGPANVGCLPFGEAGGMGEGWGDHIATILRTKEGDTRETEMAMGDWATDHETGVRRYKYSSNMTVNPETYKFIDQDPYYRGVHAKGEMWAVILWEVYWNLVEKHGFTPRWFPPPPPTSDHTGGPGGKDKNLPLKHILSYGNTLALQLILDGLKLQPCHPSFISARDAILLADEVLTHGDNYCEIWEGFARRGLGTAAHLEPGDSPWADGNRTQSFEVPEECK